MVDIFIDVWLYGDLSRYGGDTAGPGYANPKLHLSEGTTVGQLLAHLGLPTEERGITFINGDLSAMPGLQPDLDHPLIDGDRIAFFHLTSMWPFQYRHGAAMIGEMKEAMFSSKDQGLHHAYE